MMKREKKYIEEVQKKDSSLLRKTFGPSSGKFFTAKRGLRSIKHLVVPT